MPARHVFKTPSRSWHRIVDGDRVATVRLGGYFSGGVETEEQLDAALAGIREECSRLIGTGKKVIVQ